MRGERTVRWRLFGRFFTLHASLFTFNAAKIQLIFETTKYFYQKCKIFFTVGFYQHSRAASIFQSSIFRSAFNLLKCLPPFVPMPPLLRSNAYSYIVQGISTTRSRHPDEQQPASRQSAAGIPDTPTPQEQCGSLRVAALQSIMKPYLSHYYTYIYIYINIYINIKFLLDI